MTRVLIAFELINANSKRRGYDLSGLGPVWVEMVLPPGLFDSLTALEPARVVNPGPSPPFQSSVMATSRFCMFGLHRCGAAPACVSQRGVRPLPLP